MLKKNVQFLHVLNSHCFFATCSNVNNNVFISRENDIQKKHFFTFHGGFNIVMVQSAMKPDSSNNFMCAGERDGALNSREREMVH